MMERVDAELKPAIEMYLGLLGGGIDLSDIGAARALGARLFEASRADMPDVPGVTAQDHSAPGPEGAPDVAVRVYRRADAPEASPALLWIHGGGYVMGSLDQDDLMARSLADACECVVVSVDYRLAPEHPFPGPLEDCYAALEWLLANAAALGADPARIAIGGASAGGGLTAALALAARDRGAVPVIFQVPIYPMIDDRNVAPASGTRPDTILWTRENNRVGWRSYLGAEPGGEGVSHYAAPSRATDLSGLPPAYIPVGDLDLFLDENIDYARRLVAAGVPAELHVFPGAYHGFNSLAPGARLSRQFNAELQAVLRRALHG